jgi:hypothetical protein
MARIGSVSRRISADPQALMSLAAAVRERKTKAERKYHLGNTMNLWVEMKGETLRVPRVWKI